MPAGRPAIVEPEPTTLADTELLSRLFRALGDATRLRIVELLLEEGELHQAEIVRRLGGVQARASEHLACLVWCGFVGARVEGRRSLYGIVSPEVRSLLGRAKNSSSTTRPRSPAVAASTPPPARRTSDAEIDCRRRGNDLRALPDHRGGSAGGGGCH